MSGYPDLYSPMYRNGSSKEAWGREVEIAVSGTFGSATFRVVIIEANVCTISPELRPLAVCGQETDCKTKTNVQRKLNVDAACAVGWKVERTLTVQLPLHTTVCKPVDIKLIFLRCLIDIFMLLYVKILCHNTCSQSLMCWVVMECFPAFCPLDTLIHG